MSKLCENDGKCFRVLTCKADDGARPVTCALVGHSVKVITCVCWQNKARQTHVSLLEGNIDVWDLSTQMQRRWITCGKCRGWLTQQHVWAVLANVADRLDRVIAWLETDADTIADNKKARQKRWRNKNKDHRTRYMREWRSRGDGRGDRS